MEIKVFGPGCAQCTWTEALVKEVAAEKGGDITVQKVSDIREMMLAGILATPGIAIDGVVKFTGRVPTKEEIASWIDNAANAPGPASGNGCCCDGSGKK